MSTLFENIDSFYKQASLAVTLLGLLIWFYLYYLPSILLVWRCLLMENHFPLLGTIRACWVSVWPLKPAIFRKQMHLWLELRILYPKPVINRIWVEMHHHHSPYTTDRCFLTDSNCCRTLAGSSFSVISRQGPLAWVLENHFPS